MIQFHLLCENFRKIGWWIKKKAKFGDGPLKYWWFLLSEMPHAVLVHTVKCSNANTGRFDCATQARELWK